MKNVAKRLFVYFLSLALIVPNFSIPTYAGDVIDTIPSQELENINESNVVTVSANEFDKLIIQHDAVDNDCEINVATVSANEIVEDIFPEKDVVNNSENETDSSVNEESDILEEHPEQIEDEHEAELPNVVEENSLEDDKINKDVKNKESVSEKEPKKEIIVEHTEITNIQSNTITFGDFNCFSLCYDESTYTTTVTGNGSGLDMLSHYLPKNTQKLVFENCIASGSLKKMLNYYGDLISIDFSGLDTSNVTDMSQMFSYCDNLTSINLNGLDTSNVTDMSQMFSYCKSLTSIDLSDLDVSNVTDLCEMFYGCSSLSSVDLSGIDISNVTNISYMFADCNNLENITTPRIMNESKHIDLPNIFYDSEGNAVTLISAIHCNKSLKKTIKKYNIIYNLNGGKNNASNPTTYTEFSATITTGGMHTSMGDCRCPRAVPWRWMLIHLSRNTS